MPQSRVQQAQTDDDREASTVASRKPVDKFHDGLVRVSIWENASPKGAFRTASFEFATATNNSNGKPATVTQFPISSISRPPRRRRAPALKIGALSEKS
jgi:hypothetical protein